jgi:5-formyltetrahydrofolate cyclo-ligase
METKQSIRKEIFRLRKEYSFENLQSNSRKIFERLKDCPEYKKAEWIYLYIDCKNEVMTGDILKDALAAKKHVAAPKVVGSEMIFYEITSSDDLEPGYFGIREPKEGLFAADGCCGLMVMPGVAFDRNRHRVGYGGGFYDRYLSRHKNLYKAAIAFEFQIKDEVPAEPTDILPDIIITENTIYQ